MSIKAYVGRMGSGKTYEVVSVVILGALRRGRRVITNIAGIDYQAIVALLQSEGVDPGKIGTIVQVSHEKVLEPAFWLSEQLNADIRSGALPASPRDSVILPGDLVALDEIWRFWSGFGLKDADGGKRPAEVMNFMRMHRHFTHPETGVSCDLAIITQDVMDISRQVRAVIEETYRMEKHTAVGFANFYRVSVCQGGQTRKALRTIQRAYNSKYFSLYQSHSGRREGDAAAVEENIDKRGNLLRGALFRFVLPAGAVVFLLAAYLIYGFFHPKALEPKTAAAKEQGASTVSHAKPDHPSSNESDRWRVVGWLQGDDLRVILSDGSRRRIIAPPNWKMSGLEVEAFLPSGEAVASWTGGQPGGFLADRERGK